jgi:ribosome recycling factor
VKVVTRPSYKATPLDQWRELSIRDKIVMIIHPFDRTLKNQLLQLSV